MTEEKRGKKKKRKKKVCFIKCSAPRWPSVPVPVALSLWSRAVWGGEEMNRGLVSSIIQPTAASGSITLRTPVTKPHAMEQRPLPDSANYSDPLRGTKAASTDGKTEVCSSACLGKEETKPVLMLMCFFFFLPLV